MPKLFDSERKRAMCMSCIRDLKHAGLKKREVYAHICKEFKINPHKRTVALWYDGVRFSHKTKLDESYMDKWREEYKKPKEEVTATIYDTLWSETGEGY